jgi:hypothetical protein
LIKIKINNRDQNSQRGQDMSGLGSIRDIIPVSLNKFDDKILGENQLELAYLDQIKRQ